MEKKKARKKWREIRSAVTMMCVMAAMLSTATFAWFTLTSSPTVTGMQMTAASQGGLLVCETSNGTFQNAVALTGDQAEDKTLVPVTPTTDSVDTGFWLPQYTGGTVSALNYVEEADLDNYVAKYEYYIQSEEADTVDVNVGIIAGKKAQTDLTLDGTTPKASGTVVNMVEGTDATILDGSNAVRIGLVIGDSATLADMIVIEPNSDGTFDTTGTSAPVASGLAYDSTNYAAKVVSEVDGSITTGGTGSVSDTLFTIKGSTPTKVTMYIWLEGFDDQCVDEIMASDLQAQIQFTVVE